MYSNACVKQRESNGPEDLLKQNSWETGNIDGMGGVWV